MVNHIKLVIRRQCRYKISAFSIITCFACGFICAYYGITIFKNLYYENNDKNDYHYLHETYFIYMDDNENLDFISQDLNCNFKIINFLAYLDETDTTFPVDIIMNTTFENYPLIEGRLASESEINNGEKMVLLGIERKNETYEKNGEHYFKIFGEEYKVIGYMHSEKRAYFDYKVVVYYKGLHSNFLLHINQNLSAGIEMVLQSNDVNTENVFRKIISNSQSTGFMKSQNDIIGASAIPIMNEQYYCILIYGYCIIMIAIAVDFWIRQRYRELVIRKMFGFSNIRIFFLLVKDLLQYVIGSILLAGTIIYCINLSIPAVISDYRLTISIETTLILGIVILVSILIVLIRPMYRIVKMSPQEALYKAR